MKTLKKIIAMLVVIALLFVCCACTSSEDDQTATASVADSEEKDYIEETLNLANNADQEWTYEADADAWVLSIVSAVAYPELPDEQGVSVCVPGAYVTGIDTNGDGDEDITADTYSDAVKGALVIDHEAEVTSTNGQVYTADTAPVILNTGAAGYSSSTNTLAATTYAAEGYINVSCGNRGKQDTIEDESGTVTYTGDAPCCLVDQKNAARYVKYNILLGNLPGNVDRFVSTGGSGGGAHATMFAATSNNPDFYEYEIDCGAVGIYALSDGGYTTTVTIDGSEYDISDGAWGCIAYSPITSLSEADMALAFEYYMDTTYEFGTPFQEQLASYLSEAYMDYINDQNLTVEEADVGFDLNDDGDKDDEIALTIDYDPDSYPETNGYYGTYLDLYLAEFQSNLQWYLDNLDYADDWTWFDADGNALSDDEVSAMSSEDKATAFIEGRYAKGASNGPGGGMPGGAMPEGGMPGGGAPGDKPDNSQGIANVDIVANSAGDTMTVGTPDAGTTQAAGSGVDSSNYATYDEMVDAYTADIEEIEAGDEYGNNIVDLYDPLQYIGDDDTEKPTWIRMVMGASEGDMSLFSSLNLEIAMLNAGIDADVEWQWDGGHVPSEIFSESFSLYVDQMVGEYADGNEIETPDATPQTANGSASEAAGTDISSWVNDDDLEDVSFSLADAVAYRTKGASKAVPGFDVIDYGQEDYVFGSSEKDARHWDKTLLTIFEDHADVLAPLFNQSDASTEN